MLAVQFIVALNTVRKHLSKIKGGRLVAACRATSHTLVLSDVVGDDPSGAFGAAATRFGEALEQPGTLERVLDLPFGAMTVGTFLRFVAFDLTVHAWDIASVTGATVEIPDDLEVLRERVSLRVGHHELRAARLEERDVGLAGDRSREQGGVNEARKDVLFIDASKDFTPANVCV